MAKPVSDAARRAARLSYVPGMTIDEASDRFRVAAAEIKRARKDPTTKPSLGELALAALTYNGNQREGPFELARIATWIDYLNHDSCTEGDVRALLEPFIADGTLVVAGARWQLRRDWP